MKAKKQGKSPSAFARLMAYAGRYKKLTYMSLILSALSSVLALLPFVCLWRIIREVLEVRPDFSRATGIVRKPVAGRRSENGDFSGRKRRVLTASLDVNRKILLTGPVKR